MKVGFKTYTGSKYLLNYDARTWERMSETEESGPLRTQSGEMLNDPEVNLGSVVIIKTNRLNQSLPRLIITSYVTQVDTLPDAGDRWLEDS